MVDEVKLDALSIPLTLRKKADEPKTATTAMEITDNTVTVNNHIGKLVNFMIAENNVLDESARVMEMKKRIQSNNYQVNTDALAQQLTPLFAKIGG